MGFSTSARAETSISIGFGFGNRPRHNRSQRQNRRFDRHQRLDHQRPRIRYSRGGRSPRRGNIYIGGGFQYTYRWPSYYVYTSPTIIRRPVIVEGQTLIIPTIQSQTVQQVEYDEETQALFETLRYRKSQLLDQLKTGYKEQRKEAIQELAGFSFDDEVRQALESVLLLDPDAELRQEVVKAFAEVKNAKALPALEKARVEDWSQDVRKEADEAIKSIKEN